MNTADYIIKKLEELGVSDLFGLPGDYNCSIVQAVKNNSNTKWISCVNELNAGYAADGYARVRGYGAVITTYGVGELSAANAIAGSYAENVPVVHIVGIPSTKNIENKILLHNTFQSSDYKTFLQIYENITEYAVVLSRDNAKIEIDKAFKVLVKEKKPIYIAIPVDVAQAEISNRNVESDWTSDKDVLKEVTKIIVEKIEDASRPVILGDILIKRFDAQIEFREFVSKSGIPVTNFLMGVNLVSSAYENYIGTYGGNYANPTALKYVNEADCLISVGVIYNDLNSLGLTIPYNINNHIAIYGTYCYVDGQKYENVKMSDVLETLTDLVNPKLINVTKPIFEYEHKHAENDLLTSKYIYPRIQEYIKENDIIITEIGAIPYGVMQIKFPANVCVLSQMLWASSGWATPAALGASIAKPKSRVILITGEGSHQMTSIEIGNMLKCGIKPVVIVINNQGYATLNQMYDSEIVKMNYAKFARAFEGDIWATKAETEDDFDKALKVTQIMNKMCYIEAYTPSNDVPEIFYNIRADINNNSCINEPLPKIPDYIDIKEYSEDSNDFKYETVVHHVLKEDSEDNTLEESK